jgi:Tfp pilus assembly protein PilE
MKSIIHLAIVGVLACAAQSAWSEEGMEQENVAQAAEAPQAVAAAETYGERGVAEARSAEARKPEGMLELLGLSRGDGFPSKGGPID